jgi:hypothetical protein
MPTVQQIVLSCCEMEVLLLALHALYQVQWPILLSCMLLDIHSLLMHAELVWYMTTGVVPEHAES